MPAVPESGLAAGVGRAKNPDEPGSSGQLVQYPVLEPKAELLLAPLIFSSSTAPPLSNLFCADHYHHTMENRQFMIILRPRARDAERPKGIPMRTVGSRQGNGKVGRKLPVHCHPSQGRGRGALEQWAGGLMGMGKKKDRLRARPCARARVWAPKNGLRQGRLPKRGGFHCHLELKSCSKNTRYF